VKRFGGLLIELDVAEDLALQVGDRSEDAAIDHFPLQLAEPAFDLTIRMRCATLEGRFRLRRYDCNSPRSVGVRCKTSIFAINTRRNKYKAKISCYRLLKDNPVVPGSPYFLSSRKHQPLYRRGLRWLFANRSHE
jgi:hypothetical protein